jgi:anthranilate/para-aminobenzoate synthase component II
VEVYIFNKNMFEKTRTEFRSPEHLKSRPDLDEKETVITTKLSEFLDVNKEVRPYTEEEAHETLERLEELKKSGMKGLIYVVQSGFASDFVMNEIPAELRPFIEEIYYKVADQDIKINPKFEDNIIQVDINGQIEVSDQEKMDNLFRDRMGVLLGGGPHYPTDSCRTPILNSLEKTIKFGTPLVGICLGHQDLGHLAGYQLVPGMANLGPQIELPTDEAKKHPVYSRLGNKFGSNAMNTAVIIPGENAKILSRGLSIGGHPVAIEYDNFEYEGQAFSTQHHPEISVGTGFENEKFTTEEKTIELDGEKIIIPRGVSFGILKFTELAISAWEKFKKTGMTPHDIQDIMNPLRAYPTLGRNFIGPAIDWMAKTSLQNLDKRK